MRIIPLLHSAEHGPGKMQFKETTNDEDDSQPDGAFAASALHASLQLLTELAGLWKELPAAKAMFGRLAKKLALLPAKLHSDIADAAERLRREIESIPAAPATTALSKVAALKKPTTMLKLYEPEIEDE